ncbi:MAG: aldehyde ferredoxin oxidoreductase family protein [Chloroflexota bacterium]
MGGYKNRILRVDLTSASFSEEPLTKDLIHDFAGGRGFGARLLYGDLKANTNPLSKDNEIIFMAGPLAGTRAQSFGRWKVFFKSPLTGGIFKSSGGGHFATELKFAGFDGIAVKGTAEKPCYLWVHDGKYELRDATYLWGLGCNDTHTLIREELNDPLVRMACIGPSGERGVKISGVFSDRRSASRGGGGAVMGIKNLKAVAVRGTVRKVEVAEPDAFQEAVRQQTAAFRTHPTYESRRMSGTRHNEFTNLLGMYPVHNFQDGILPNWEKLDQPEFAKLTARHIACSGCMLRCGAITKASTGKYSGAWTEGPEYETIWGFSGPIGVADTGLVIAADNLCDNLGLDTISVASSIGFAYELYERGIITKEDTGGLELVYGKDDHVLELIKQIAYREGFGDVLANGTREAARHIGHGSEKYAIHVKGLELPAYDPRGAKAHGLNLLTTNNGADHCSGYAGQEVFGSPVPWVADRFSIENKGALTKWNQDSTALNETGILCTFANGMMSPEMYGNLLSKATGVKDFADPAYLWLVGERIFNLERMFNVRDGFSKKDDVFPARITTETMPSGNSAGQVFEAEPLLKDYYRARGWDANGIPTKAKLNELGLGFTTSK